jgi:hypothetical protein
VVDEDLQVFNQAVKPTQCDWLIREFEYYLDEYKFKTIKKSQQKIFDTRKILGGGSSMQGIHWYSILNNPVY